MWTILKCFKKSNISYFFCKAILTLSEVLSGTECICAAVHCSRMLPNALELSIPFNSALCSLLPKTKLQHTLQVLFICFPYRDVNPGPPTHFKGLKYLSTLLQSEATLQYMKPKTLRIEQKRQVWKSWKGWRNKKDNEGKQNWPFQIAFIIRQEQKI